MQESHKPVAQAEIETENGKGAWVAPALEVLSLKDTLNGGNVTADSVLSRS